MPINKVYDMFNFEYGLFDVVIIDEASQSNVLALPILSLAKKVIIVGDPEQISPDSVGTEIESVNKIKEIYLSEMKLKNLFDLKFSLWDLADTIFSSNSQVMLVEHFRCVPEIIEFCNKLSYNGKIVPLKRINDSKIEPTLKSIYIADGFRDGNSNKNSREAEYICGLIKKIVSDPIYKGKTVGVISLLGQEQAKLIDQIIDDYISSDERENIKFRVGDAYNFQGDERDIIILSMVIDFNSERRFGTMLEDNDKYKKRINVAVSRSKEQLILVHSIKKDEFKNTSDIRYNLLDYIENYKTESSIVNKVEMCESVFEEEVYKYLYSRGYNVEPQVKVGKYRIDLVVKGKDKEIAVECDGARYHTEERWEDDKIRQNQLERAGWEFYRIWGTTFYKDKENSFVELEKKLNEKEIYGKCF